LTQTPSPIGRDQFWELFCEDGSRATPSITAKAPNSEAEDQAATGKRQVSHGAVIPAVDTLGPPLTERTSGATCGGSQVQPDGLALERYVLEAKTSQLRQEQCE
jgi:hypothetical protein